MTKPTKNTIVWGFAQTKNHYYDMIQMWVRRVTVLLVLGMSVSKSQGCGSMYQAVEWLRLTT
jgi:hypothetical protein